VWTLSLSTLPLSTHPVTTTGRSTLAGRCLIKQLQQILGHLNDMLGDKPTAAPNCAKSCKIAEPSLSFLAGAAENSR
jgi:hypothetical protein